MAIKKNKTSRVVLTRIFPIFWVYSCNLQSQKQVMEYTYSVDISVLVVSY